MVFTGVLLCALLPLPRRLCFHQHLFLYLFVSRIMQKPLKLIFTKYIGKVAHGGIPDRITLWLGLELGMVMIRWGPHPIPQH